MVVVVLGDGYGAGTLNMQSRGGTKEVGSVFCGHKHEQTAIYRNTTKIVIRRGKPVMCAVKGVRICRAEETWLSVTSGYGDAQANGG